MRSSSIDDISFNNEILLTRQQERVIEEVLREIGVDTLPLDEIEYDDTLHSLEDTNPIHEVSKDQQLTDLSKEIKKLPAKTQEILTLYFGLNNNEVHLSSQAAKVIGVSKRAINYAVSDALKVLKRRMIKRGH